MREPRSAATLLVTTVLLAAGATAPAQGKGGQLAGKLAGTLRAWLQDYRRGKLAVGDDYQDISGKSRARRAGLITKEMFQRDNGVLKAGQFSYREELEVLLQLAGKSGSADVAKELLPFCAVGLDDVHEYAPGMVPFTVRDLAEQAFDKIEADVTGWLAGVASGTTNPAGQTRALRPSLRAAALRALAARDAREHRSVLQAALQSPDRVVRVVATEQLGRTADAANLPPLVEALAAEKDPFVERTLHLWIARLTSSCDHKVDAAVGTRAEELLGAALGRPDASWHHQAQVIELTDFYNRADYVPRLIDVLARFAQPESERPPWGTSGLVRDLAWRKLTKLTDTYHAIDDVESWRRFWTREKDGFKVAVVTAKTPELARERWLQREAKRRAAAGEDPPASGEHPPSVGMGSADFFGVPVRGGHVVFVVDVGAGTKRPAPVTTPGFKGRWQDGASRLDVAKAELRRAIGGLTHDATFEVLAYSDRVEEAFKRPRQADPAAVQAALKFVDRLAPRRNYDFAAGLTRALDLERVQLGRPGPVEEVFVVYNQLQQVGAIKDPDDFVRLAQDLNRSSQARIHTVYLGGVADEVDKQELGLRMLKQMAEATGGLFVRP